MKKLNNKPARIKFRKGDSVIVIAGKDKGKQSTIIELFIAKNKVLVEGVNLKKKHQKGNNDSKGGIMEIPAPIDVSNIALFDPKTKKPSRIGYEFDKKGKKIRIAKKSGSIIKD